MTLADLSLGFSTIAGSVLSAYISLGVPPENLVTASVMSIPASIAISKLRMPEMDEPITRGHVTINRGDEKDKPANALHAFSKGALFGLVVAGQILYVSLLPSPQQCTHANLGTHPLYSTPSTVPTCSPWSPSSRQSTAS